jgi:FkbM family methyltransferase
MKQSRMTYLFFSEVWKKKSIGFYVEIGAWDGKKKNSTIVLENAGWDGVCIEASPPSYEHLIKNRKCRCLNIAVFNYDGEVDFAIFQDRPEWNGIVQQFDNKHQKLLNNSKDTFKVKIQKVPCKTWSSLHLPQHIDYLQIDTEGSEIEILKCIDWPNTSISYICLEDNNISSGDFRSKNFMLEHGYECILEQNVDYLWRKVK